MLQRVCSVCVFLSRTCRNVDTSVNRRGISMVMAPPKSSLNSNSEPSSPAAPAMAGVWCANSEVLALHAWSCHANLCTCASSNRVGSATSGYSQFEHSQVNAAKFKFRNLHSHPVEPRADACPKIGSVRLAIGTCFLIVSWEGTNEAALDATRCYNGG